MYRERSFGADVGATVLNDVLGGGTATIAATDAVAVSATFSLTGARGLGSLTASPARISKSSAQLFARCENLARALSSTALLIFGQSNSQFG